MSKKIYTIISIGILTFFLFSMKIISDFVFTLIFLPTGLLMLYYGFKEFRDVLKDEQK